MRFIYFAVLAVLLTISASITAQDNNTCPAIVQNALDFVSATCLGTGRNQACYGNLSLTAVPQPDVDSLEFDMPGDIADVSDIQSLRLSPMDEDVPEWGIALMNLQANLPDTLPGQNVTFLLFGDVEIESAVETIEVTVSASGTINVRGGPSTDDAVVTTLPSGATIMASGRNEARDWIRVQLEDDNVGWIAASLLQSEADLGALPVVEPGEPIYGLMQAFYIRSGVGDARCAESPHSGLLIQTPEGAGEIEFMVNEVKIRLGSTAFLQSEPGHALFINVLEGKATVSALDKTVIVPAGALTFVRIDDNLTPTAAPVDAFPYNPNDLQSLPVSLLLRQIEIKDPLTPDEIATTVRKEQQCFITASAVVNIRQGPGTAYPIEDTLVPDRRLLIRGQATGTDGLVWWRIREGRWVRSDLVETSGNCADVTVVEDLPPVPTAAPVVSGRSTSNLDPFIPLQTCQEMGGQRVPANTQLTVSIAAGGYQTAEEAEAAKQSVQVLVSMNGVAGTFTGRDAATFGGGSYHFQSYFSLNGVPPGSYEVVGFVNEFRISCIITAE